MAMATSLADSPPAPPAGQAPPDGANGAPPPSVPPVDPAAAAAIAPPSAAAAAHSCARCGSQLAPGQDWCLSCGAGAPGSLGTPSWRSAATILGVVMVLVLGAAAAAVAALSKGATKAPVVTKTVAQAPAASASTPVTPGATSSTPGALGTTPGAKSGLPSTAVKPPKIPLTATTPKASETATTTTPSAETKTTSTPTSTTPASTTPSSGSTNGESSAEESQAAIVLDTDAASTYNPYGYAASGFGDASLAIDGDPATAWTAAVNSATAPKMAQGLLIDLKAKQKVAVLELITSTPGMTVQVYGAKGHTAPASITDPTWIPLSAPTVAKKKHLRLALRDASKEFTFITLWISNAPESSVGTAAAPGHVDVNELELFAPKS
jgi:hypothetical protein